MLLNFAMDNSLNSQKLNSDLKLKAQNSYIYKNNLIQKIERLKVLCDTLNPYEELSNEEIEELNEFGIVEINNPFTLTNNLLLLMENSIEELQNL